MDSNVSHSVMEAFMVHWGSLHFSDNIQSGIRNNILPVNRSGVFHRPTLLSDLLSHFSPVEVICTPCVPDHVKWDISNLNCWVNKWKTATFWTWSPGQTLTVKVKVVQSCLTLCNPMDCNLPGSSVHGILQVRTLERVVIPFSRGSSWSRNWTGISCIARGFFTSWATGKPRTDWCYAKLWDIRCVSGLQQRLANPEELDTSTFFKKQNILICFLFRL